SARCLSEHASSDRRTAAAALSDLCWFRRMDARAARKRNCPRRLVFVARERGAPVPARERRHVGGAARPGKRAPHARRRKGGAGVSPLARKYETRTYGSGVKSTGILKS